MKKGLPSNLEISSGHNVENLNEWFGQGIARKGILIDDAFPSKKVPAVTQSSISRRSLRLDLNPSSHHACPSSFCQSAIHPPSELGKIMVTRIYTKAEPAFHASTALTGSQCLSAARPSLVERKMNPKILTQPDGMVQRLLAHPNQNIIYTSYKSPFTHGAPECS